MTVVAAQLAIYLGWVRAGITGATVVGVAFVGPSFVMVLALSAAYVRFGWLAVDARRILWDRRSGHRNHCE